MRITYFSFTEIQKTALLKLVAVLLIFCNNTFNINAQTKNKRTINKSACKIGNTNFRCPDYFKQDRIIDKETTLFKYESEGTIVYFFAAVPQKEFDDTIIRNLIAGKINNKPSDVFRWRDVKKPGVMNLETKYETKIVNRLGYNNKMINFVTRYFNFNGKNIVLGYGYDTNSDGLVEIFEKGNAIGDQAVGCNAIATVLNSITKEKKGGLQYCFLNVSISK